ncbi:ABC transporter [Angomonas deanei]|uniref:ABC transporter, putative n=1 Tax=Angomonas deanei TaxID=59799 RepID=A0A7G2CF68_9TRYP|nr:ABC transporter [Angomonas deanei]CAD2218548.1 ABC transporter, putative [Angomonas deanei]|eukprot:EPY37610.1 ABC transporter [Angomonas deanei]
MMANIRLSKIGFVFQTFNLLSSMTAVENVELPMTLQGKLSSKERRERAKGLLQLVGLHNRANHLPSELSGGEQQRVTIARSLANNPSLLLLDEPTGDLDTQNTIDVMDLLIQLNRLTQCTLNMVTHNPDLECYADRILYVSDGRFARQVINVEPQGLDYDRYNEYLKRKETEKTQLIDVDV